MRSIALPLALLALPGALAAQAPTPQSATRLDVSATGTVHRVPDVAAVSAGVVTLARDAGTAMTDNATRMGAVVAALRKAGIAERDIQTASLSLQPQYRYADNQPPVLTGYQASNRVSVRLRALKDAGKVLDALVAAGANQIDGPNFTIDQPEAALDEARTQALATARARAERYAKAAGMHVARILLISENGGGYARPPAPMPMMAMRAKADTPVEAGEQDLSVTLAVTFELQ